MKRCISFVMTVLFCIICMTGCASNKEQVVIYTAATDYRIENMQKCLQQQFPEYDILVEYQTTSKLAAKLLAEGTTTDCDIIHDLAYLSLDELNNAGILADLSNYETSQYTADVVVGKNYLPEVRTGGAIILNTELLREKNIPEPQSYEDLLKPEYKGLISMPSPKASGTGYMFLKNLVNIWGEAKAFDYFDKLSENVMQFTSSGVAPINLLSQKEVAIGISMISPAVVKINEGAPLKILIFEEGAPYSVYGQGIIKGKETRESVNCVFEYMVNVYNYESCKLFAPEKIYNDVDFEVKNYPTDIVYSDMSNDNLAEKNRLLELWDRIII